MVPDGRCLLEAILSKRYKIADHFVEDGTQGLHYCGLVPFHDDPQEEELTEKFEFLKAKAVEYIR